MAKSKSSVVKYGKTKAAAKLARSKSAQKKPAKSKPVKKRATPIKKSSKTAKKAASHKPAKKTTVKAKAAPKRAPARKAVKPAVKKTTPKKAVAPKKAASRHAPVKHAPAAKHNTHKHAERHAAKAHTGGVAVAKPGSEPTITKEDGRYALPATVTIELPKNYHPLQKEEYMGPKQLAYFRNKLRDWRDQLVEESRQTMENLREEVRDVGDDAERATRETENSLELRTRDRYRKLISKIDNALRRIEEGRYGFCEETDEEIGIERLEARPIATLSLDAQERREHLQKQMGD